MLTLRPYQYNLLNEAITCMGAYVWDWFYTPAEFRDRQIDKILEDG